MQETCAMPPLKKPLQWVPDWITPNRLTVLRALLVVPVILTRHIPWLTITLLILSSACDFYDGRLARARNEATDLGSTLDPIADKVFVLGCLWCACRDGIHPLPRDLLTGIELGLLTMRPLEIKLKVKTSANLMGKIKTWVESFALAFILTRSWFFTALVPYTFAASIFFAAGSLLGHVQDVCRRSSKHP